MIKELGVDGRYAVEQRVIGAGLFHWGQTARGAIRVGENRPHVHGHAGGYSGGYGQDEMEIKMRSFLLAGRLATGGPARQDQRQNQKQDQRQDQRQLDLTPGWKGSELPRRTVFSVVKGSSVSIASSSVSIIPLAKGHGHDRTHNGSILAYGGYD